MIGMQDPELLPSNQWRDWLEGDCYTLSLDKVVGIAAVLNHAHAINSKSMTSVEEIFEVMLATFLYIIGKQGR